MDSVITPPIPEVVESRLSLDYLVFLHAAIDPAQANQARQETSHPEKAAVGARPVAEPGCHGSLWRQGCRAVRHAVDA